MITQLNDSISIIDTIALGHPNVVAAYLISGKEKALVDMGFESSADKVIDDLEAIGVTADELDYLLPTHVHLDHSGSCGSLAKKFGQASIRVHPKGEPHLVNPTKLWKTATELFGSRLMEEYGMPKPIDRKRLRAIGDEETINLGEGVTLRSLWTPGHASHHLSYVIEETGTVLTGDAIGVNYPDFPVLIPTTPPTSFNMELALESLERIRQTARNGFLAPHFGIMNGTELLDENIKTLRDWKTTIERGVKEGGSPETITKMLQEEMSGRCGRPITSMPDYVRGSISRSVLGFIRYLRISEGPAPT
jgi:glyoxylase-like metal-dependent hydrolase (beta-lactamase superfamily II)